MKSNTKIADALRIALLANGIFPYEVGGMQKHTTYLTRYLAKAGVQVDLYFIEDERHPSANQIHEEQFDCSERVRVFAVPHWKFPYFPGHYYFTSWWKSRFLAKAVLKSDVTYDFVYAQGYTGWAAEQERKRPGNNMPPVGVHSHGIEALQEGNGLWFNLKNSFAPVWQRKVIRLADVNLSLGGKLNDLLESVGASHAAILPAWNGIDENWLCDTADIPKKKEPTRFLFVGRDTERKGFRELNHVLQEWVGDPRLEMHFVGNISSERHIDAGNMIYHSQIRDENKLRDVYRASDVLLIPSHSEGMPTVILEAFASGMSVIASDVGAVRLVVDESMGWIIKPRDMPALANAIREAVNTDFRQKRLSGRRGVEGFTWPVVVDVFLRAIAEYLGPE